MPQNKNFQKRITILDGCFASRTGSYTLEKLMNTLQEKLEIPVSRKTIQNDIKYIKETIEDNNYQTIDFSKNPVFIPKLFDGKKSIFKYADENLALGNQLLSKSDQEQLEETLAILSRYRNREDFFWLDELFPRIEEAFNLVHEDYSGLISYQSNRDYSGQSWVGKLYNVLLCKKVVEIEYKAFQSDESVVRKIHPYHLKQYNDRWFLFGLEEVLTEEGVGLERISNLALDRIESVTETLLDIKEDTINWGDFFDEMIGVSKPYEGKSIQVKLKFSKNRIPYILTKPIHGASQRLDPSDAKKRTIIINVIPNRELFQLLLSFGKDVKVIEPIEIASHMKKIAKKMKKQYKKSKKQ